MDVYGEKVLKQLGLPTAISKIEDLNYFQILKLDPSVDDDGLVRDAAARQLRRLRDWQKEPYRDFANRMELAIVKARKALMDPVRRAKLRQQFGGSPELAATRAVSQAEHPGGKWESAAPVRKTAGIPKWVNILIVVVIVLVILMVIKGQGGLGKVIESLTKAIGGG